MESLPRRDVASDKVAELDHRSLDRHFSESIRMAVLIPCFNEANTVATVISGFKAALPAAEIYVFDNNSTDQTVSVATAAGATVRKESLQGKGNVVRRMFADINADVYVMVDGDSTYDPRYANSMVNLLLAEKLDMIVLPIDPVTALVIDS
jgi:glycosyltransferase involved in cell wall biosynthesis